RTAQPAVRGHHQHAGPPGVLPLDEQGMVQRAGAGQVGQHVGDLRSVRPRRLHPGLCLRDTRCRDQLLGLGDLLDGPRGPDPSATFAQCASHGLATHFFFGGGGLRTCTDSFSRSASSIASTPSSGMTDSPLVVEKPFLNSLTTFTSFSAVSSESFLLSRMSVRISWCEALTCSRNSASNRWTSSIGTESRCPLVPRKIATTWSSTGVGLFCGCLSTSTSRAPRSSCAFDVASRSEANAANASSSRYWDRSSRSEPATSFMALIWAAPPTRDTDTPTLMAGRTPWLNRSVSRKHWPSVIEMTLVGM